MAWIETRGEKRHLGFRFGGQRYKKALGTMTESEANRVLARVERRLQLIESGDVELPEHVDLPTYLVTDGRREAPVTRQP